ncbi:Response regulator receiver domain protein [Hoeflea sp. IMCC20628]|uniref:response regulator n=1 Tax=Hoeflea sp. IMCC20628 TaxID=1620421 RepID=UPI00063A86B2|nr:response regulator [Hoeflea sp. IMCC20628]AKI02520.1 Response regulator receiver domain protein [Hoeflea sp. IMCC20628]
MHHQTGSILVLEDQPLIALDLEELLSGAGFDNLTLLSSCAEAESWLKSNRPDAAILDINLRDGECTEVAHILAARSIPFIIHSGNLKAEADSVFLRGTWIAKPAQPHALLTALHISLAASEAARSD